MNEEKKYSFNNINTVIAFAAVIILFFNSSGIINKIQQLNEGLTKEVLYNIFLPVHKVSNTLGLNLPKEMFEDVFYKTAEIEREEGFLSDFVSQTTDVDLIRSNTKEIKLDYSKYATNVVDNVAAARAKKTYTKEKPLKVLLIGDSMIGWGFGTLLQSKIKEDSTCTADLFYKVSTGLTQLDYFNWFTQIERLTAKKKYDLIVVMLGTNDAQGIKEGTNHSFGTKSWVEIYDKRVHALLNLMLSKADYVCWLGMPVMRESSFDRKMNLLNKIFSYNVTQADNALYIPTSKYLADENGKFTTYKKSGNKNILLRLPDGIHVSTPGAQILANAVYKELIKHFAN